MAVGSLPELFEVLGSEERSAILGTTEGSWLDFKSQVYKLDTHRGVADLVADVAAFANGTSQGVLLLGVHEKALEDSRQTVASDLRGIRPEDVNDEQVLALVRQNIRPLVQVEIRRYPVGDTGLELVALIVTPALEHERPCIVERVALENGTKMPHAIGWPTRHGADTYWETPGRIQQLLAYGLRPGTVSTAEDVGQPQDDVAAEHLEQISSLAEWQDWSRLVIQAIPVDPTQLIPDFYGQFAQEVRSWRGVRPSGFNLGLHFGTLQSTSKQLLDTDEYRYIAVHRSGVLTAAVNGTPGMLGWSMEAPAPGSSLDRVIANPFVVVEFPTEAIRFAAEMLAPRVAARTWTYRLVGRQLKSPIPLYLRVQPRRFPGPPDEVVPPTTDGFDEAVTSTGDFSKDAFEAVAEIYGGGWGRGRDDVPFATDGRIDLGLMN